jgi:cytochrome P450
MALYTVLLAPLSKHPYATFFLLPLILFTLRLLYRISPLHPLAHVPGPYLACSSSVWLTYHAWIGDEASTVHALHEKYGPIVRTGPNSVDVSDGAALATIYTEKGGFGKAAFYANFDIDGHKSIFSETDPLQRAPRAKAVAALFSTSNLRQGQDIIYKCVDSFVDRLAEGASGDQKGKPLNILNLTRGLAVDAVSSYLLGGSYGALDERSVKEEKKAVKGELVDDQDGEMSASGMVNCFVAVGRFWYLPNTAFKMLESIDAWWNAEDQVSKSLALVDEFVAQVVSQAESALQAAKDNERAPHSSDTGHPSTSYPARMLQAGFTVSEVHAQCKDLIFAGTDSTGMNLATILFHLVRNPQCYSSLRQEILTADPSFDDLQSLPCLRGVVKEGLRLSMANPSRLPRVVPRQGWTFKGTYFPPGTVISCTPYSLHLNPTVFPDPSAFKPERWLEASEEMIRDAIPFGLGTRQCIARNLASVELFCAIEKVVRADVLMGAKALVDKIEILEWFNSKVVGERIDLVW